MRHSPFVSPVLAAILTATAGIIAACSSPAGDTNVGTVSEAVGKGDVCHDHKELMKAALAPDEDGECRDNDDSEDHGRHAFNNRKLHRLDANGRACADCHMASESFQLSAAAAQARFDALQKCRTKDHDADDPLFRPIDADDFRTNGNNASSYVNLTHGLVRITFTLPSNVRLIDPATNAPSSETEVDVWRSVPSVRNVAISGPDGMNPTWPAPVPPPFVQRGPGQVGPNTQGGYQLDGRIDTLQNQALAAFRAHAQVQSDPSQNKLDAIAAFENTLNVSQQAPLSALEQEGAAVFARSCAQCHGGAAGTTPITDVPERYHNINSACPRPPVFGFKPCDPTVPGLKPRTYEITLQTASGPQTVRRVSSDPGRFLLTGYAGNGVVGGPPPLSIPNPRDDFGKLDIPPLHGIAQTAPYFHNNTAANLDEVLDHYTSFFNLIAANSCARPQGCAEFLIVTPGSHTPERPFTAAERPALRAFLDRL
jgi:cytochrome c peroxidase